ncbi:MAG: hypothetical protein K5982_04020 [Selenomonadaceae bacterium]|nr:hypothetical protein [Selenomonadaceae bacterium]
MTIHRNELTNEMIAKAMKCETADELRALAKAEGYDLTKEEAEAYFAELADVELDEDILNKAAGGCLTAAENGVCYAVGGCAWHL